VLLQFYKEVGVDILIEQGKYEWAINYLQLGLQVDPNDPAIRSGLRKAYMGLGKPELANRYR